MYESCRNKQAEVEALFADCQSPEARYERIIQLGRKLPKIDPEYKTAANRVEGCQSRMYLHSFVQEGVLRFEAESDALISAGLAYLLVHVYDGESPEAILKCPPAFLETLQLKSTLTPSRANGLYSLHLRMKQDALKAIVNFH